MPTTDTYTQLRRDPFGRDTFIRETVPAYTRGQCHMCTRPGRFHYGWLADGLRSTPRWNRYEFCSIDCYRSYYVG